MPTSRTLKLIAAVVTCEVLGLIGSVFTVSAIPTWYATLTKPFLNPPSWIFGPVWTTLYLMMGVSLWLIWQSTSPQKSKAIGLFALQLGLNILWTPLFFGAHWIGGALVVIVLLWMSIALTIAVFRRISQPAAYLLVPYIAWVSFATYLNFSFWRLN